MRVFHEASDEDVIAEGVTLNGEPVVVAKRVTTYCDSFGNADLCHTNCPFWVQCKGGLVNVRDVEV